MNAAERIVAAITASLAAEPERYSAGVGQRWITKAAMPLPTFAQEDEMIRVNAIISSSNADEYGDRIMPEAFKSWLQFRRKRAIPMLQEHDRVRVAGAWTDFELKQGDDGGDEEGDPEVYLHASGLILGDLSAAKDCEILIDRGFINATSIGAFIGDIRRAPGSNVWDIGSIDIREASLVMWPANLDAEIQRAA